MANVYTRHRSNGPVAEYATAQTADTSTPPETILHFSYSNTVSRGSSLDPWVGNVTFTCTGTSTPGPWDILIGETMTKAFYYSYGHSSGVTSRAQNDTYIAFIAYLDDIMKNSSEVNHFVSVPIRSSNDYSVIQDVPTRRFKKRFSNGEIINNPVLNEKTKSIVSYVRNTDGHYKFTLGVRNSMYNYHTSGRSVATPNSNVLLFTPPSEDEIDNILAEHLSMTVPSSTIDARQIAINTAYGNINSGTFAYLEELGEAKETIAYIASVLSRIGSLVQGVKRGKFAGIVPKTHRRVKRKAIRKAKANGSSWKVEYAKIALDHLTSAWMELRFAIRPLMFGIEDAIKIHQEGVKAASGRTTVNGRCDNVSVDTTTVESDDGVIRTVTRTFVEGRRVARSGVLLEVNTAIANMRTLGFTNIVGTMWELTFLSWAIDYFVNLDGLLYHLTPDIGVEQLTAWVSTDDLIIIKTDILRYDSATGELLDTTYVTSERNVYHREPVTEPSLIEIDVNLDVQKIADLGSLFYGLLRSTKIKGVIK